MSTLMEAEAAEASKIWVCIITVRLSLRPKSDVPDVAVRLDEAGGRARGQLVLDFHHQEHVVHATEHQHRHRSRGYPEAYSGDCERQGQAARADRALEHIQLRACGAARRQADICAQHS